VRRPRVPHPRLARTPGLLRQVFRGLRRDASRHEVRLDLGRDRRPFGRRVFRLRLLARLAEHPERAGEVPREETKAGTLRRAACREDRRARPGRRAREAVPRGRVEEAQAVDDRGALHHEPVHGGHLRPRSCGAQRLPPAVQPRDRRSASRALAAVAAARPGTARRAVQAQPQVAARYLHRLRLARPVPHPLRLAHPLAASAGGGHRAHLPGIRRRSFRHRLPDGRVASLPLPRAEALMSRCLPRTIINAMGTMQELRTTGAVERAARIDLAAAFRLAARMELHEGVCNHFSLMLPDGKRFLLNRYGLHWSEVTASNLLALDADGHLVEGEGEFEKTAFYIHSRIHLANPRAACVLHTHMPYATTLTLIENGRLEMVEQNALRFHEDIAYDDTYNGLVVDNSEGDRLARVLGRKRVLFLANHGVIVVGPTVAEAFDSLYYLERACRLQVLARSTGAKLRTVRAEVVRETCRMILDDTPKYAGAHFGALKRILDREEPGYSR